MDDKESLYELHKRATDRMMRRSLNHAAGALRRRLIEQWNEAAKAAAMRACADDKPQPFGNSE